MVFGFVAFIVSIVFVGLQSSRDANLINEITNSTGVLIETGVCRIYDAGGTWINEFIGYNVFEYPDTSRIIEFNNRSFNLPSVPYTNDPACPNPNGYGQQVYFSFGACTTNLSGTEFTVSVVNNIISSGYAVPISKTEQAKFDFVNPIFGSETSGGTAMLCYQDQYFLIEVSTNYGLGNVLSNAFKFNVVLVDPITNFTLVSPLRLALQSSRTK
jgi:hypothetical protein